MRKILLAASLFVGMSIFGQKKVPNVSLKNFEGVTVSSTENFQEKDKIYVFSFWATWCAPCLQELDTVNDLYDTWKSKKNMEFVAVTIDDARTIKRVKPMVSGKGWTFPVLYDGNQEFKRKLGIVNVPYLMVVKNGEVLLTQSGHTPGGEEELFNKIEKL
ncbi:MULTISPECIES: TlpA family protein disulfide reductase [Amniculibacterium]|jgi:thiol-disulfide isomerase/thioredoxin|uniref:TlpA family protein disulfide reductase n=1 Tax=Amniculibacterium TaxID=2715289 RepID=UPI000F5974D4|nr:MULTISPECIES: TlpA disulfide reductase family protein [Amniculibacterium]